MGEREDSVLDYVDKNLHTPLKFSNWQNSVMSWQHSQLFAKFSTIEPENIMDVEKLVEYILARSYWCDSLDETGKRETEPDCRRSSIDIWRHAILYKPELTIFYIMRTIHSMSKIIDETDIDYNRSILYSLYCPNIKRRVFKLSILHLHCITDVIYRDEYGMVFSDWEHIGEK